jgi:broad specificity phosphatase PhoE
MNHKMKQKLTAMGLAGVLLIVPVAARAQKLVILVRHAERADGGAPAPMMPGTPADPLLSAAGEARAARLATMLADSGVKAIFATEFKRTQDTGKPLAATLGLKVQSMPASDTAALVAKLKAEHASDVVLVVGHSNSVPEVIKALGGPDVTIADTEFDALFVFVPATGALAKIRF